MKAAYWYALMQMTLNNRAKPQRKPYADFDFDLAVAVQEQLIHAFEALPVALLNSDMVDEVEARHGVYQFFEDGRLECTVTSKSLKASLKRRLADELKLGSCRIGFKCIYVDRNWMPYVKGIALD